MKAIFVFGYNPFSKEMGKWESLAVEKILIQEMEIAMTSATSATKIFLKSR
jgi:hypothetical protein